LIQVADLVLDNIGAPDWVIQTIMLVIALGFPVVAFFSWAYEVTPEGIKRESEVDRSQSISRITGRKLDYSILTVLILALSYYVWESQFSSTNSESASQQQTKAAGKAGSADPESASPSPATADTLSIAVLPFANRSNLEEDLFFTDGIHDDLLTTIAKIGSMKVISRTSVMEYRGATKKIPEIAQELGVANILEGGIQRSGNQVRINVQLINARTDEHLWAESYDRELTAENLFTIQSEISRAIAVELQATLTPQEADRIDAVPTTNLEAYEAYLRGKQLMATRDSENLRQSIQEYNRAVELDPEFALAWVGVADSNALFSQYAAVESGDFLTVREDAINHALDIDGLLGEAYASLGLYYKYSNRDADAELAFRRAIELSPNYATAYHWYSNFLLRDLSRIDEAVGLARQAVELDPNSSIIRKSLGDAYKYKGLHSMAEQQFLKIVERDSEFAEAHYELARLYSREISRLPKALIHALKATEHDPGGIGNLGQLVRIYLQFGDREAANRTLDQMADLDSDHIDTRYSELLVNMFDGNDSGARESLSGLLPRIQEYKFWAQNRGSYELIMGDKHRAREIYLAVVPEWMDAEQWPGLMSKYSYSGCIVSWILINTDDEAAGERLLMEATAFYDERLPLLIEHVDLRGPEVCYLTAGDTERALKTIETQLEHNHLAFWEIGHRLPMYDLIRHEPRYLAVMEEREKRLSDQRRTYERELKN
jgi:TolB-like protein/Tfp pilus assembly protein PilF